MDHREFYIGKLMPGQDKMVEKDIFLPYGFDDEFAELQIVFRDPKNRNLQEFPTTIPNQRTQSTSIFI